MLNSNAEFYAVLSNAETNLRAAAEYIGGEYAELEALADFLRNEANAVEAAARVSAMLGVNA
jgi:hypothetical protein